MANPTDTPDVHIEGILYCGRCSEHRAERRRIMRWWLATIIALAGALGLAVVLAARCLT